MIWRACSTSAYAITLLGNSIVMRSFFVEYYSVSLLLFSFSIYIFLYSINCFFVWRRYLRQVFLYIRGVGAVGLWNSIRSSFFCSLIHGKTQKNHWTSGNPRETTPMNIPQILAEKLIILRLSHSPGHPTPMAGERDARPTFGGEVGLRMESTNGRIKIMVGI